MLALSVLLPVRDARPWIEASMASLWRQTFRDFEVIAVDDGSTDGSGEWLDRAAAVETRLRVIHTEARGIPAALRTALDRARGNVIARHDADDLSHRSRFELQYDFLSSHAVVGVVGCVVRLFPAAAVGTGMRRWADWHNSLVTHEAMERELLIDSPLAHGGAMIRRAALQRVEGWRDHGWAEDLDLWVRLFAVGTRFAKMRRPLYAWRQHPRSATRRDPRYQRTRFMALKLAALERGLLRGSKRMTLVGVGRSLEAWSRGLAAVAPTTRVIEAGRPWWRGRLRPDTIEAPMILVFGSARARDRWRAALSASGLIETKHFVFVA